MLDADTVAERPERFAPAPVPAIPEVDPARADVASVEYSHYRTDLSRHRTELSEHRTDLSEYRTDLSSHRTALSDHRTEMSMRRTGMSFQRTRMSADRTLMSELRTSLSMIGFGFTLYQVFQKALEAGLIVSAAAPRNFGMLLIVLGVVLLLGGIWRQIQFGLELRRTRAAMAKQQLIHADSGFPVSVTLIVAIALVAIGILALLSVVADGTPFG